MTDAVIDRLNTKKLELEERLASQNQQWGSQRKEALQYKIKKIEELVVAYQSVASPVNLAEAKEILDQQVGFEEQKKKILESLEIERFRGLHNIQRTSFILCLSGPPGVGKTTFALLLAKALKKEFFSVALGGLSDASVLLGASENSSGSEIGQLTRALSETKKCDPLILLDEIDKAGSSFKTAIHDCLINVLDSTQNNEVLDYYLDVKIDFSQVNFVATANDLAKIPEPLRDRMLIVELPGYGIKQKKEIAQKIIQSWFNQSEQLNQDNLEITPEALETLISKTNEKGVRQLKMALEFVFEYCSLQWAREESQQEAAESKITITPDLVDKIIPQPFSNADHENNSDKNRQEEFRKQERGEREREREKELKTLRWERDKLANIIEGNNQNKLKASKFHALIVIRKALNNAGLKKNRTVFDNFDYEKEINNADSVEEVEALREKTLLCIMEKFPFRETNKQARPNYSGNFLSTQQNGHKVLEKLVHEISKMNENSVEIKNLEERLTKMQEKSRELKKQLILNKILPK
jgi:DNA polymerase III delta prime subunit